MRVRTLLIATFAACAMFTATAHATPIMDFTGGVTALEASPTGAATRGYEFSVTTPLTVSALGIWDEGADGLGQAHTVYLWTNTGVLLASATVNNSSTAVASSSTNGDWRFSNIVPLALGSGSYVLGETSLAGDPDAFRMGLPGSPALNISGVSGVTYLELRQVFTADTFPGTTLNGYSGYFGPNILSAPTVPEPASMLLLATGLVGMGARRWRNHRQRS